MRELPRLILCLTLGVLATCTIAWSCTLWSPFTGGSSPPSADSDLILGWPPFNTGPDGSQDWWSTATGRGIMSAVPLGARGSSEGGFNYWRGSYTPAYRRAGWPALALASTVNVALSPSNLPLARWQLPLSEILRRGLNTDDLPPFLHAEPARRLALVPLWPDFAIDTAIFGTLGSMTISAFTTIRRALRRRRNLCPACAYNLAGLPLQSPCPECGHSPPQP